MKLFRLLASLLTLMLLHPKDASGQPSAAGGGDAERLHGHWTLTRLTDEGVEHPLGSAGTVLHFAPGDGMDGRAAVNDYVGQYAADPAGGLRWLTSTRSTRRGGPAELLRLESAYLHALSIVTRWDIVSDGSELHLSTADGKTVLAFRRQANPPS